ncbi:MAG: methyltransferase domain-containing protein, partial [Pseudomonadota bacterium]
MRTDILDLHRFYETPLGGKAAAFIGARLAEVWGDGVGLRIGGFGYAGPFLKAFPEAERRLNFAPEAQGVVHWPPEKPNASALVADTHWPLPDASLDRVLIVHGLEETHDPHRLMREIWRVLAPDGRLVVVAAHRRGFWSALDMSPFAAGRPYSRRQL